MFTLFYNCFICVRLWHCGYLRFEMCKWSYIFSQIRSDKAKQFHIYCLQNTLLYAMQKWVKCTKFIKLNWTLFIIEEFSIFTNLFSECQKYKIQIRKCQKIMDGLRNSWLTSIIKTLVSHLSSSHQHNTVPWKYCLYAEFQIKNILFFVFNKSDLSF